MRVVFIDRDGVINRDSPDYIKGWHEFDFLPGVLEALALFASRGVAPVVVTNQSGLARGLFSPAVLEDMHARMCRQAQAAGGPIRGIYHCPHHPADNCACRKPRPGLLLAAAADLGLDLARTAMVGDNAKDVAAGKAAGCGATVLVRSGLNGGATRAEDPVPDHVAPDLYAAAEWLLARPLYGP